MQGQINTPSGILSFGKNLLGQQVFAIVEDREFEGFNQKVLIRGVSKDEVIEMLLEGKIEGN